MSVSEILQFVAFGGVVAMFAVCAVFPLFDDRKSRGGRR